MITSILLQTLAVIINTYIAFTNKKKHILVAGFIYNAFCLILFFLIKDYAGMASYVLIVFRSAVYLFQDKLKPIKCSWVIPSVLILLHVISGAKAYVSVWSILPILAPSISCYLLWFETSRQRMRIEQAISDNIWLVYYIYAGLYVLCISRVVAIVSGTAAFVKNFGADVLETKK